MYSVRGVALLMRRARMSTSYKPALLRALVRLTSGMNADIVPLERLGDEFARVYWSQTVVHKLRQAEVVSKEAEVVREIRKTGEIFGSRRYSDLPSAARAKLSRRIARILTVDVLSRFHRSKPQDLPDLFLWKSGDEAVTIGRVAREFITRNALALEMIANYAWAAYLERCNRLAPRIVLKVSGEIKRESLQRYRKVLISSGQSHCFYCDGAFAAEQTICVDHVIPWSFALEDKLWDLVLTCPGCNRAKSDWLPHERFIKKLVNRNDHLRRTTLPVGVSLLSASDEVVRLFEVAVASDWPRFWEPNAFSAVLPPLLRSLP